MAGPGSDQLGYADAELDEGDQLREAWVHGLRTLFAVSQHISTSSTLPVFFGALTRTIAHLTGAERAAFWAIQPEEHIAVQPQAYGFAEEDFEPHPIPSAAGAVDVAHAIVAPIGRESVGLFRGVSHSAKLALQPFVGEAAIGRLQPQQ